jgi:hypothetical protein
LKGNAQKNILKEIKCNAAEIVAVARKDLLMSRNGKKLEKCFSKPVAALPKHLLLLEMSLQF